MARGRMLNNSICGSKKFHDLPDDTCRLLATWLISQLDVQGVFYGDPAMVKSYVFPRRDDITAERVEGYLQALEDGGLILRFESNGDTWQYWPGFAHNQVGLRTDRENPQFPTPPATENDQLDDGENPPDDGSARDSGGSSAGQQPAEEKGKEEKGREQNPAHAGKKPPPQSAQSASRAMFGALAGLCQIDWRTARNDGAKGKEALRQSEKILRKAGALPIQLGVGRADKGTFAEWWYTHDWRGKEGQPPQPAQVRDEWGQFVAWIGGGGRPRLRSELDAIPIVGRTT